MAAAKNKEKEEEKIRLRAEEFKRVVQELINEGMALFILPDLFQKIALY